MHDSVPTDRRFVQVGDATLDVAVWGSGRPEVVLLHDGLGSIDQFVGFGALVHAATGQTVMAYDRPGHGKSTPIPTGAWPAGWMHDQALLLTDLLDVVDVEAPILVGHSDGGSIALIHAHAAPGRTRAVVALAAHSFVEPICVERISAMRRDPQRWLVGLARFHAEPKRVFEAWSDAWVSPEFRDWDIRGDLGAIVARTVVVQGDADEYATAEMASDTAAAIGANAELVIIPKAGHLLPQNHADAVLEVIAGFG